MINDKVKYMRSPPNRITHAHLVAAISTLRNTSDIFAGDCCRAYHRALSVCRMPITATRIRCTLFSINFRHINYVCVPQLPLTQIKWNIGLVCAWRCIRFFSSLFFLIKLSCGLLRMCECWCGLSETTATPK